MKIGDRIRATRAVPNGPVVEGAVTALSDSWFRLDFIPTALMRSLWRIEVLEEALDPDGLAAAIEAAESIPSLEYDFRQVAAETCIRAYLRKVGR